MVAARYKVGIDYENYTRIVEKLSSVGWDEFTTNKIYAIYEKSLYVLSIIAVSFPMKEFIFFGFYAVITILCFYFGSKKISEKYTWLSMLLYFLIFLAPSMNGMRQYAAISLTFFASMGLLYDEGELLRKNLKFIALVLLASLLHSSAILALFVIPIKFVATRMSGYNATKIVCRTFLFAAAIVLLGYLVIKNIEVIPIVNKYKYYLNWDVTEAPTPNLIPRIIPVIVGFWLLPNMLKKSSKNYVFYYLMSVIAFLGSLLGYIVPYGYRVADYFLVFQIPLFIDLIKNTPIKKEKLFIIILIGYGLLFFLYSSFFHDSHGIFPYQFL